MSTVKFVQAKTTTLSAPITSTEVSSIVLKRLVDIYGNALALSDFGDIVYITLDPGTDQEEIISATGFTVNADDTVTLDTGIVRGLNAVSPYASGGTASDHSAGSIAIVSDNPQIFASLVSLTGAQTIAGIKTFSSHPVLPGNPTLALQAAPKQYVDLIATGIATYAQNIVAGVAGEALTAGLVCYLKSSDGKWYLADSATASKSVGVQLGIAQTSVSSGAAINILLAGLDQNQTGLTAGTSYYLSTTGTISSTKGANIRFVGRVPNGSTTTIVTDLSGGNPEIMTVDGSRTYVADTGAADAYAITLVPAISAYKAGQVFSFLAAHTNTTASTLAVNGLTTKAIKKLDGATALVAGDIVAGQIITVEYDGTNFQMLNPVGNAPVVSSKLRFGGTGADGALAITSGATNIDVGAVQIYTLNYTSLSITGTGSLTFSNPHANGTIVIIRVQGNITLTSSTAPMIDCSGMGGAGGTGGAGAVSGTATAGNAGTTGTNIFDDLTTHPGGGGPAAVSTSGAGAAATAGTIYSNIFMYSRLAYQLSRHGVNVACGSGGGGGGGGSGGSTSVSHPTGATGGRGGGGLIIECGGAWNFTTALGISVAGKVGGTGTAGVDAVNTDAVCGGAGGGGGAGGFCVVLYNTLTANSGTINTAGGAGGPGGTATKSQGTSGTNACASGSGGAGAGADGGAGGAGAAGATSQSAGNNGTAAAGQRAGGGGGSGGACASNNASAAGSTGGAAGASENVLVAQNIWFA